MFPLMKFSIRDLMLVTVIVAILVAWWIDHRRQANEIRKFKNPWPGYKLDVF